MILLELKNLKKTFFTPKYSGVGKNVIKAVDNVDFFITQGKNIGLVGESGSGKSTLARLIVKLYTADSGKIIFKGDDVAQYSQRRFRRVRQHIQMVFQDPYSSLDPRFMIRGILKEALGLMPHRLSKKDQNIKMAEVLQAVGLSEDILLRFPHEFSGGERQRIAIARALIMKPELLILDEAVSSLDVLVQAQIIELLKELQSKYGLTYMFITHNLRVVRKLCDQIAVMYQGKIIEMAPTEELFHNPIHPYTKNLLKAAIDYKTSKELKQDDFTENSRLIDEGNGHFVIK